MIDSLVVSLGLDASAFTAGQKKVVSDLRATEEAATSSAAAFQRRGRQTEASLKATSEASGRAAKAMAGDGAKAAEWFSQAKNEALGLIGLLTGSVGLEALIKNATTSLAGLGRQARNIGESPQDVTIFSNTIAAMGGNADAAKASLEKYAQARQDMAVGLRPDLPGLLSIIGADRADSPLAVMKHFMEFVERNKGNPQGIQQIQQVGGRLGFDQGLVNAMIQIGTLSKYEAELADARKRGTPTPQMIEAFTKLQTAFEKTQQAADNLTNVLLSKLAPSLTNILNQITKTIENPGSVTAPPDRKDKSWWDVTLPHFTDDEGKPESLGDLMGDWWNNILGRPARGSSGGGGGASGGPQLPIEDPNMLPIQKQFLTALASGESGGANAYDAQNPTSSAHGRWQMISSTNAAASQLTGITGNDHISQERKAWAWASQAYSKYTFGQRSLLGDLQAGGHENDIAAALRGEWPSLPGGSQQNTTMEQFIRRLHGGPPETESDRLLREHENDRLTPKDMTLPPSSGKKAVDADGWLKSNLLSHKPPDWVPGWLSGNKAIDPALVPPTGGPRGGSNDNSTSLTIGSIVVNSQATNAAGIAKDIHKELAIALVNQANRGAV